MKFFFAALTVESYHPKIMAGEVYTLESFFRPLYSLESTVLVTYSPFYFSYHKTTGKPRIWTGIVKVFLLRLKTE